MLVMAIYKLQEAKKKKKTAGYKISCIHDELSISFNLSHFTK